MARGYQAFLELRWKESAYFEADGFFVTGKTRLKKSQPISRENVIGILLNLDASSPLANTMSMFREPWLITSDGPDFGSMKLVGCGGLLDVWICFAILRHPWQVLLFVFPFDFVQFFALADLATLFSSHSLVVQVMRLPFLNDCEPLWSTIDRPLTQFHKPITSPTQFQRSSKDGIRVSDPQPLPENLKGKALFPHATWRISRICSESHGSKNSWMGKESQFLVDALEHLNLLFFHIFPYIGNNNPIWDFHIFQRGRYTTNQMDILRFLGKETPSESQGRQKIDRKGWHLKILWQYQQKLFATSLRTVDLYVYVCVCVFIMFIHFLSIGVFIIAVLHKFQRLNGGTNTLALYIISFLGSTC